MDWTEKINPRPIVKVESGPWTLHSSGMATISPPVRCKYPSGYGCQYFQGQMMGNRSETHPLAPRRADGFATKTTSLSKEDPRRHASSGILEQATGRGLVSGSMLDVIVIQHPAQG